MFTGVSLWPEFEESRGVPHVNFKVVPASVPQNKQVTRMCFPRPTGLVECKLTDKSSKTKTGICP